MKSFAGTRRFSMQVEVAPEMCATFLDVEIHPLYSTYDIARHAEHAARQIIVPLLDDQEDAVGGGVEIMHRNPAMPGDRVTFDLTLSRDDLSGNIIVTPFTARCGERLIAEGRITQSVGSREKIQALGGRSR